MRDGGQGGVRPEEVSALILAAGKGERLGNRAKAFVMVGAVTLVERVVAMVKPHASEILVGLLPDHVDKGRRLLGSSQVTVVAGGVTRQETVTRLLARATLPLVLIHDVARPCVTSGLFAKVLSASKEHGAATLYLPVRRRDQLALRDGDSLGASLSSEGVIRLQTPNAYRREILLDADRQGNEQGWIEASTTSLVVRAGYRVHLVRGTPENVKLTYPEDWDAVETQIDTPS